MATTQMSFIRYRYKSEKDFKMFLFARADCSVGYLKQSLMDKPSKGKSFRSKDEIDFTIIDASTNEGLFFHCCSFIFQAYSCWLSTEDGKIIEPPIFDTKKLTFCFTVEPIY